MRIKHPLQLAQLLSELRHARPVVALFFVELGYFGGQIRKRKGLFTFGSWFDGKGFVITCNIHLTLITTGENNLLRAILAEWEWTFKVSSRTRSVSSTLTLLRMIRSSFPCRSLRAKAEIHSTGVAHQNATSDSVSTKRRHCRPHPQNYRPALANLSAIGDSPSWAG